MLNSSGTEEELLETVEDGQENQNQNQQQQQEQEQQLEMGNRRSRSPAHELVTQAVAPAPKPAAGRATSTDSDATYDSNYDSDETYDSGSETYDSNVFSKSKEEQEFDGYDYENNNNDDIPRCCEKNIKGHHRVTAVDADAEKKRQQIYEEEAQELFFIPKKNAAAAAASSGKKASPAAKSANKKATTSYSGSSSRRRHRHLFSDDLFDQEGDSSSDDSETSSDSDSSSSSSSSSSEEDFDFENDVPLRKRKNAKSRGKKAPSAAKRAAGGKKKQKKSRSLFDDDLFDEDDDNEIFEEEDVNLAKVTANPTVSSFQKMVKIPFLDRETERNRFAIAKAAANDSNAVLGGRIERKIEREVFKHWRSNDHGGVLPLLRPPPTTKHTVENVEKACSLDCPCLFMASAGCYTDMRRKLILKAHDNRVFYLCTPRRTYIGAYNVGDFELVGPRRQRVTDGSYYYELDSKSGPIMMPRGGGGIMKSWNDTFKQTFGAVEEPPQNLHRFSFYVPGWDDHYNWSTQEVTEDNWRQTVPCDLLQKYPNMQNVISTSREPQLCFYFNEPNCQGEHQQHHLYLYLMTIMSRSVDEQFGIDNASLSAVTLPQSRDGHWRNRFAIDAIANLYLSKSHPNLARPNEFPPLDQLWTSIPTRLGVLEIGKHIHPKSAKEFLQMLGTYLTRSDINYDNIPLRPQGLVVDLHPHQRRAVHFMLDRERNGVTQFISTDPIPLKNARGVAAAAATANNNKTFRYHVNMSLGAVVAAECGSELEKEIFAGSRRRGGILADEVGMGKTIAIISLCLMNAPANPQPEIVTDKESPLFASMPADNDIIENDRDMRTFKESLDKKLKIKATLVLAPVSLVGQWEQEISRRAPGLKVLRFHGQRRRTFTYASLAAADIVITTYETYRAVIKNETFWFKWFAAYQSEIAELFHDNTLLGAQGGQQDAFHQFKKETREFATQFKKHRPSETRPFLSRIHFRRIVLDEYHRHGGLSTTTQLVQSDYCWLVSGTPLDASLTPALKRIGIMDYSFVEQSRLAFAVNNVESKLPHPCDSEYIMSECKRFNGLPANINRPFVDQCFTYEPSKHATLSYAQLAIVSQYMIRNTVDTCPELRNVTITERLVHVQHNEEEKEKYNESLTTVRQEFENQVARGVVHTRILEIIRLLNALRKAAIDPKNTTILARNALAVGFGAQFDNDNERRNIIVVPVDIFSYLLFPAAFPEPTPFEEDGPKHNDATFKHVSKVTSSGSLKDELVEMQRDEPELPTCSICLDNVISPVVTECGHIFCRVCILLWMRQQNGEEKCPNCQQPSLSDNKKKYQLSFPKLELAAKQAEEKIVKEETFVKQEVDQNAEDAASSAETEALAASERAKNRPTKINAAIQVIQEEMAKDNTSKFLLFTSFPQVITTFMAELKHLGIGFVVIDGSSSLQQRARNVELFQDDEDYTVRCCIVSSRVGNAGLTLTAANHLLMLEPATSLDVDIQTIGRVRRLGQKRPVTVHRLLVRDTIEVPLLELVKEKTLALSARADEAAKKASVEKIRQLLGDANANAEVIPASDADSDSDLSSEALAEEEVAAGENTPVVSGLDSSSSSEDAD